MPNTKKLISAESEALPNNEYVVDGALLRCDSSVEDIKITFKSDPNRRYEIGGGIAATDIDTKPSNIKGNFGKCKNTGFVCNPDFLPKWFNACESAVYQEKKLKLKVSEIKKMFLNYRELCRRAENLTNTLLKYESEKMFDSFPDRRPYKLAEKLKFSEEDMKYLNALQKQTVDLKYIYGEYKEYPEWTRSIVYAKEALTDLLNAVQGDEDGENDELQKLLTISSVLVCKNLGSVQFATNGQGTREILKQEVWPYFFRQVAKGNQSPNYTYADEDTTYVKGWYHYGSANGTAKGHLGVDVVVQNHLSDEIKLHLSQNALWDPARRVGHILGQAVPIYNVCRGKIVFLKMI